MTKPSCENCLRYHHEDGVCGHSGVIVDKSTRAVFCDYYSPEYDDDEYERRKNNYV